MVIDYVKNKYLEILGENIAVHIWSDGCASQFKSRYVFSLMSNFDPSYDVTWYYNERHHGKGPMDGLGGTIKIWYFAMLNRGKSSSIPQRNFPRMPIKSPIISRLYI